MNPTFESPNIISIEVGIRSNISGIQFAQGELIVEYPKEVFGTNVVANELVEVLPDVAFPSSDYSISVSDHPVKDGVLVINLGNYCDEPPTWGDPVFSGTSLSNSFHSFAEIKIEIQDLSEIGSIALDDIGMSGNIFYLDPVTKECTPFNKVAVPNPTDFGDVCDCSFSSTTGSWYYKENLFTAKYQSDVYVFRSASGSIPISSFDTTIVDSIYYNSSNIMKHNVMFFNENSTQTERDSIKHKIRIDGDFLFDFPVLTDDSNADWTALKWFFTTDLIHIVFQNPTPDAETINYIMGKYNLSLYHKPSSALPVGQNSWSYIFKLEKTDCSCRNTVDLAQEIYKQDASIVKIASPAREPSADIRATNDPYYGMQWSIENTGQCIREGTSGTPNADIDAPDAWAAGFTGQNTIVAVIDKSLYDSLHPDISPKYIHGFNFIDSIADVTISSATNSAHGQACAGVIGAIANNQEGGVGIAYDAQIIPISTYFLISTQAFPTCMC
jgi:hypothetical protein